MTTQLLATGTIEERGFDGRSLLLPSNCVERSMKDTGLKQLLTEYLPDEILEKKGQILYSGIDTLRPGRFYFLGLNPRTDDANVVLSHERLDRTDWSAYTQQCWRHKDCNPECPKFAEDGHQKNVQRIMCELGIKPEQTFATNLIFVESRNTQELVTDPLFQAYL